MAFVKLPSIGDLVTFSDRWDILKKSVNIEHNRQPVGIITNIISYTELSQQDSLRDIYGTLAYPITVDIHVSELSRVFVVQWASNDALVKSSYTWINEEWFYNESFIILSKA